jgi:hypothetical protein
MIVGTRSIIEFDQNLNVGNAHLTKLFGVAIDMTIPPNPNYLYKKEFVIEYLNSIINTKSQEVYEKRRKESIFTRSPILKAISWIFSVIKQNFFKNKHTKSSQRNTFSPANLSTDFLRSMNDFSSEIREMEIYISEIISRSSSDKKILEECENYLNRKCKMHLVKMSPMINVLALILFTATIFILVYLLGYFPASDIKTNITDINSIDTKIVNILASSIAVLTASTVIANTLLLFYKPFVEDSHIASTSAYEYCIELLKNARLRID